MLKTGIEIIVTKGFGMGSTEISAFDSALQRAGVANYNLIPLSSVIPQKAKVRVGEPTVHHYTADEHGKKLYVVIAKQLQNELGLGAYAGLGWVQSNRQRDPHHYGRGLFVEHTGLAKSDVQTKIFHSLRDMVKARPEGKLYGKVNMAVHGGVLEHEGFACAVVVAAYQTRGW